MRYFRTILPVISVVLIAGCAPQSVVTVPTLAVLPSATPTEIATLAVTEVASASPTPILPSATPTVTPSLVPTTEAASPSPEPASPAPADTAVPASATPLPATNTAEPPTVTPSLTITPTITLTPSSTLTPTADVGGFSALLDLAARVTVLPPEVRYGPATATALWAIGDRIAGTARAAVTPTPTFPAQGTPVFAIVPGATLPQSELGTLPPAPGGAVSCGIPPGGALGALLVSDPVLTSQLGCAIGAPVSVAGAVQPFERGAMIYRASTLPGTAGIIEALSSDGRFTRYTDTWVSGIDPDSANLAPPPGLFEPIRGFGKIWRGDGALAARLGWALSGEQGASLSVQAFERGVAIAIPAQNVFYLLVDDGTGSSSGNWRQSSGGF